MPRLCEVQQAVRDAVVADVGSLRRDDLRGGSDPLRRLAIHRRHYHASTADAVLRAFPATRWLCGEEPIAATAAAFVRAHPPAHPCMAEYGGGFPAYVAEQEWAAGLPYLADFAALEWWLGRAALGVDAPSVAWVQLAARGATALERTHAVLQPGVHYLTAAWPVDVLMRAWLSGDAPSQLQFGPAATWLEVRGSRGEVTMTSLQRGDWVFRRQIQAGASFGEAAAAALAADPSTDVAAALVTLATSGLIVTLSHRATA